MMDGSNNPQNSKWSIDDEVNGADDLGTYCSSDASVDSISSSSDTEEEEEEEDATSPPTGPLHNMSSLMNQLPPKKGLSRYFQGKSRSFTSISAVRCLEDLAKPENPYTSKKLKSCKSYGGNLKNQAQKSESTQKSSRTLSNKASASSCSSINAKKNGFLGYRPPVPRHRTSSLPKQTPLYA